MRAHAVGKPPFRFSTSSQMIVAVFRRHDAAVTLRKIHKAGIAVPLVEALVGDAAAMDTFDLLQEFDLELLAEAITQVYLPVTKFETVAHRITLLGVHLMEITLQLHPSPGQAEYRFLQRTQAYLAPAWAFIDDAAGFQQLYGKILTIILQDFIVRY